MSADLLSESYAGLCEEWVALADDERRALLESFRIGYSYNSGGMENPEITYHDTAEVFDNDGVSNFTGDVRTIYEINNLKRSWAMLEGMLADDSVLDTDALLEAHKVLTAGTYNARRWSMGERPGTFKVNDFRVADDVGVEPAEAEPETAGLVDEVNAAASAVSSAEQALTIAAYAHAKLVDIHPFADGNGRVARFLMNYLLMKLGMPPISIAIDDKMAYFGALDAFHYEGELEPFKTFLKVQAIKTWEAAMGLGVE